MKLDRFEQRMMKLKGVKLPSQSLKVSAHKTTGRPPTIVLNHLVGTLLLDVDDDTNDVDDQELEFVDILDDILVGCITSFEVASTHKGFKLSKGALRNILNKLPIISTLSIRDNYGYSPTHAKLYVQACRLAMLYVRRQEFRQMAKSAE